MIMVVAVIKGVICEAEVSLGRASATKQAVDMYRKYGGDNLPLAEYLFKTAAGLTIIDDQISIQIFKDLKGGSLIRIADLWQLGSIDFDGVRLDVCLNSAKKCLAFHSENAEVTWQKKTGVCTLCHRPIENDQQNRWFTDDGNRQCGDDGDEHQP